MNYTNKFYPESQFGGFSDIDSTIIFYNRINALLKKDYVVLNIGCGRGQFLEDNIKFRRDLQQIKKKVKKVIGIDIDQKAKNNSSIDDFKLIKKGRFPIHNNSIDLCVCDYVLEHIENPFMFFKECNRVLKKGGYLCLRTTNLWSYLGLAAKIIPQNKHAQMLNHVQEKRLKKDVFKKFYRANSIIGVKSLLTKNGFDYHVYGFSSEPAYFNFSKHFYALMALVHHLTPNYFKVIILGFAKKK